MKTPRERRWLTPRQRGTNQRAKGTNPREQGTNPRAIAEQLRGTP